MQNNLDQLSAGFKFSGELQHDIPRFLTHHGYPKTAEHCLAVGAQARALAARFGADEHKAEQAGWLHDVSAVIPNEERLAAAHTFQLEVLPEEAQVPMILHQKLSVVLARDLFGVQDEEVLSAAGCHTTLKAGASTLDQIVFLADKLAWDQTGEPPYRTQLLAGLDTSLQAGLRAYLEYVWARKDSLKVIHPWLAAACAEFVS